MREDSLSPREHEIAEAYAGGDTYHIIAERLCIAPSTVRTHLAAIYRKLCVSSKLELHKVLGGANPSTISEGEQAALISELALSLEEAISRERALSEVLRIISGSEGRIDEVIEKLLGFALELCDAEFGLLLEYNVDRGFRATYTKGIPPVFHEWWVERGDFLPSPQTAIGRMAASHEVVNIVDVRAEGIYKTDDPLRSATVDLGGARSFTAIPMLAGKRLIGAFTIYRQQLRPFDEKTVQLAQMFADQSAIAIENARMMSELRSKVGPTK
ncbi:MAG: GAF domain-containing protein [Rhodospirillaceae bacterium]|nr:GAF domain-containing protein [Rhodospirillaceae bacterium]MBT3885165.1 GAF domain-containing protein [Rhodospirillaceae bacterium]MBT4118569.1 GAF domain-containing protein [Rhodospirillaceae bacterium]MBT4672657.1 GAF domain-containing protein [Rhodospirillaceae bacterium]MBT4721588.1 GAF domain-containing protein [Rhodospirillaceae bacterium]